MEPAPAEGVEDASRRIARNSGWLLAARAVTLTTLFVQGVLIARTLGPRGFGVFSIVTAYTLIVVQLFSSRVWEAAIKFVVEFHERGEVERATAVVKLCYLVDLVSGIVVFAVLLLTAGWAARSFAKDPSAADSVRLFAVYALIAVPVATATAMLRVGDAFRWLAIQAGGESLARLAAVVVIIGLGYRSVNGFLVASLFGAGVGALGALAFGRRTTRGMGLVRWRRAPLGLLRGDLGRIARFMAFSNVSGTSRLVTSRIDVLFLGWFADPSAAGIYRLARTISDPLAALFDPLYQSVYPELARLVEHRNLAGIRSLTDRLRRWAVAAVVPVALGVTLVAGWLIPSIFGERFVDSVPLVRIMIWQLVWTSYIWLPGLLLSLGRSRSVATLAVADMVIFVILLAALAPTFGATGAAVAMLLRFIVWTLLAAELARRTERDLAVGWA